MSTGPLTIETHHVTKRFGERVVVSQIDLAVPVGCVYGLLGHNGAGKTTLIRMLLGLTQPDAGTITIGGRSLAEHRQQVLARVGAIIEEPRFHPHLSGRENLWVIAAARGGAAHRRIGPALDRVGLTDRARDRVGTYSQGMRQRLGIARCLLADPMLVVLDEPTNGLDPGGIHELRRLTRELAAEGRTVLVSSHLIDEVEKSCDAAAVIHQGRLIAQGLVEELTGDPAGAFVVTCEQPTTAYAAVVGHPALVDVRQTATGLRVHLVEATAAGWLIGDLSAAGIVVTGFAPERTSLEDRFMALTSRVGEDR